MSADPSEISSSWDGAITSRWTFQWALDDALFEARTLADSNPLAGVYSSIIGMLDGMTQLVADGRTPEPEERPAFHAMAPSLRMMGELDARGEALVRRVEELSAYLLEWPAQEEAGDEDQEPQEQPGESGPLIGSLDLLIATIYRLRGEIDDSTTALKQRVKRGSFMARAKLEAAREAERELMNMLSAIDSWADNGTAPGKRAVRPGAGIETSRQLYRYVSEQAGRMQQVRRSYIAWRKRVRGPGEGSAVASFEQVIIALHQAIAEAAQLRKIAPNHEAIGKIADQLDVILRHLRRWITDWDFPERRHTGLGDLIAQDIDLLDWPQLPRVQTGVRQLAAMLAAWPPESMNFFRRCLYETAIDLDLLRTVSSSRGVDNVAREVNQLLYRTADGKEPAKHERKEFRLGEMIARELDIYASPVIAPFVARVRAIDSFWQHWWPPTPRPADAIETVISPVALQEPAPVELDELPPTRHEAERAMLTAIQDFRGPWQVPSETYNDEGSAEQNAGAMSQGYSRAYFHHLLDGAARDLCALPMRYPFSRALALQLRAMRRWTDQGAAPTQEQRSATGSAFAAMANIAGADGAANHPTLREIWPIHAYFQRWPEDDKTKQWTPAPAGVIAGPEHLALTMQELVADAAALLVLFPNHDVWLDINRQLQRLNQCAKFGRQFDAAAREEVTRALADLAPPPAGVMSNVPGFAADFVSWVRQAFDYSSGRRASSRPAFEAMLRAVLDESRKTLAGRNWEDDEAPLAAIDRQLRAMQRWIVGGRTPWPQERQLSRDALDVVSKLHGLDRMQEWARRVTELAAAFAEMEETATAESPPATAPVTSAPIASAEEFGLLLDQTIGDCKSLSGRTLMHKPSGDELVWDKVAGQLAPIRRMLDQGRVPSQRERAEIHGVLVGVDPAMANPCPSIHDFLPDVIDRLRRIDAWYTWLVTAGPYAGKEAGGIAPEGLQCVTLGGEMRVAFVRTGGSEPGIYVCMSEKKVTPERAGSIEFDLMRYQPTTKNLIRLVPCQGWSPAEIRWNAHSDYLAYLIPGASPQVGWCETRAAGEKGRVNAAAFAWATKGSSLIGVDLAAQSVFRVNADTGEKKELVKLPADLQAEVTPCISIPPGGDRLALTYARAGGIIELSFIEFDGARPVLRVRKQFADATAVLPFWSNVGEAACLVVNDSGTDIISLPILRGDGELLYHSDVPEERIAPAWSSTGKYIVFFQSSRSNGAGGLVLFDCDTRESIPLLKPGAVRGRLTFGEETLSAQGADSAVILYPHISHKRQTIERF